VQTRLAENAGRKRSPKMAICAPSYKLSGYIFATNARPDNRKNSLLSSNISPRCSGGDFCWRLAGGRSGLAPKARVSSAVGARIEVPRGVESGEGVSPWEGAVPPPQKIFSIFELKKASFGAFWVLFLQLN